MPDIEEQEMRGYLLGSLSPERDADFENRLHHDADLKEQLLAIEAELFDQFIAGSLSVDEQQRFEGRVLNIDGGQQKLHFATLFANYRNSHFQEESFGDRVPAPNSPVSPSPPLFASVYRNPAFAILTIGVVGLVALLFAWTPRAKSPPSHIARTAEPMLLPTEVTLLPRSLQSRGGIQHVEAPPKNVHVRILLELAKPDFTKYKTQLFRENQALESQEELTKEARNAHYVVPVTVIGGILTPGDYQLKLSGVAESGEPEFIDSYPFRVTPESPAEASDSTSRRDPATR